MKIGRTFEPFCIRSASVTCPPRTLFRSTTSTLPFLPPRLFSPPFAHARLHQMRNRVASSRNEDRRVYFQRLIDPILFIVTAAENATSADSRALSPSPSRVRWQVDRSLPLAPLRKRRGPLSSTRKFPRRARIEISDDKTNEATVGQRFLAQRRASSRQIQSFMSISMQLKLINAD